MRYGKNIGFGGAITHESSVIYSSWNYMNFFYIGGFATLSLRREWTVVAQLFEFLSNKSLSFPTNQITNCTFGHLYLGSGRVSNQSSRGCMVINTWYSSASATLTLIIPQIIPNGSLAQ